jgi:N-methylhydantoinase B
MQLLVGGGGGWGDPLDREPAQVIADVRDGYVSADAASRDYGVVIDAHGDAAVAATESARADARKHRDEE